jgi:hypothetical protein
MVDHATTRPQDNTSGEHQLLVRQSDGIVPSRACRFRELAGHAHAAFTLAELLVTVGILVLLVLLSHSFLTAQQPSQC